MTDVIESPDFGTGHSVRISDDGGTHIERMLEHNLNMGITAVKVGIYHSHPKMGVFMSVIDVGANRTGQVFGDEHVSIVIDSMESVETGRLEIGAFRRYQARATFTCCVNDCLQCAATSLTLAQLRCRYPPRTNPPALLELTRSRRFKVRPLMFLVPSPPSSHHTCIPTCSCRKWSRSRRNESIQTRASKQLSSCSKPACRGCSFLQGSKQGRRLLPHENEHMRISVRVGCIHAGSNHFVLKRCACSPCVSRYFLRPCNFVAQMVPDLWMTPLLASPLIDSSILAVKSTEICAKAAEKASSSSSSRGIFDHSNSLIGSESEISRACAHCASLIAFQERCIVVDQVCVEWQRTLCTSRPDHRQKPPCSKSHIEQLESFFMMNSSE